MGELLKANRRSAKGNVTREINNLKRWVEEEDKEEVTAVLQRLKDRFNDFMTAHEAFHANIQEEELDAIEESDTYRYEVQDGYLASLRSVKQYLKSLNEQVKTEPAEAAEAAAQGTSDMQEFISLLNLPKVEIETFSGDPLQYHSFLATFDEHVDKKVKDSDVKLSRLQYYTSDDAKTAIRPCSLVGGDEGYKQARETLARRFGNPHVICEMIVSNLKKGKPVRSGQDLQRIADELINGQATLKRIGMLAEVECQSSMAEIINRLQPYVRRKWKNKGLEIKRDKNMYPTFADLVEFVKREAEDSTDPVFGSSSAIKSAHAQDSTMSRSSSDIKPKCASAFTSIKSGSKPKFNPDCVLCGQKHKLLSCEDFRKLNPGQRLKLVKEHRLCENCLYSNHVTADCKKPSVCTVTGCGAKHSKFIHMDNTQAEVITNAVNCSSLVDQASDDVTSIDADVFVPIVSVVVNDQCKKFALLDNASNTTFCTRDLVKELNLRGSSVNFALSTLSASCETKQTQMVDITVMSEDRSECLKLSNVYVVDKIPVVNSVFDVSSYKHLCELPIVKSVPNVDILIGQDNAQALMPLEISKGKPGEPFATRTILGWSLNGSSIIKPPSRRVVMSYITACTTLEEKVERLWKIENDGLVEQDVSMSQQDRKVIKLWDEEIKYKDNHYILPIPWKDDAQVPNNIAVAHSRLSSLKRSLDKRDLVERYDTEIKKLTDKGYAEEIAPEEIKKNGRVWYLPHQAVITDKKPGKLRVVHDCASKFLGESLNEKCLRGPDLNNKLLFILLKFRQHQFAIMADVEAMYFQVRVPQSDRDALRFLWFDSSGNTQHYRMTSHIFGGVWCACAATYALRRTVQDNPGYDQIVVDTINNSFYVDDCLKSTPSRSDARKIIEGTKSMLSKGGFKLTKFVINDEALLQEVPVEERATEVKDFSEDSSSKALGVKWNVKGDEFYFQVDVQLKDQVTKRQILSIVSSNFDPLGLVSPVTIVGKVLFQDCTRLQLDWDEPVPDEVNCKWRAWMTSFGDLKDVMIPRCIKPHTFDESNIELHHFSDASERAYGCCSYIRCVNKNGEIHTALIMSKGKVTPTKPLSIPRLELQAATLSARIGAMLLRELDIDITRSYFWTDSLIVLQYIKNDTKRFQVYVGNRVSMIRSLSEASQWYHVPGKENPADLVTRGQTPQQLKESSWYHGPDFLKSYKTEWPQGEVIEDLPASDTEVRGEKSTVCVHAVMAEEQQLQHPLDQMISHYSGWQKLKRAVGWWIRYRDKLRKRSKEHGSELTVQEVKGAELVLIKHVQSQAYSQEINLLKKEKQVTGSLQDLLPVLNEDGVICVGGRLKHGNMSTSQKHPVILPYRSPLSDRIARWYHNVAHVGTEWTLCLMRMSFWIIKGRSLVKQIKKDCVVCKKLYRAPCIQQMADLPQERLEPNKPPFSCIGLDCFGPFYVKIGRAEVKRYGCVFTCFCTRAIHIEKLDSLETDSFLNGFRRFSARRGYPVKAFSDNGTNITGAQAELSKAVRQLDRRQIQAFSVQHEVEWHFNPPHASHMGGLWERMIRTIRRVMSAVLKDCRLNDEVLVTLLCEVEAIVNSRPLTKVSDDVKDMATLTPNHLLLLREGPKAMPGEFGPGDMYRKRWRYIQHLADQFWRRWVREYLPILQHRSKWTQEKVNVKVGDVVLVCDETTPRSLWPMGLVVEVKLGRDDLVRSVKVKTRSSELVRPITKVVMLEAS